ncbi:hypothetical protein E2C01_059096 [Portunus trituberculatus]|uniref:Uncharacterized protein n=1 Tax=Portunus trituberculatus TaxID=210409 RepID=A0A5B7H4G8_PORTR|nr:hypothetical protein [Portunus trituberculatus]
MIPNHCLELLVSTSSTASTFFSTPQELDRRTGLLVATGSPQQLESQPGVPTCRKAQGKKK